MSITFTFVCLAAKQVATHVDVQTLAEGDHRRHALQLLREHASVETVEVWRDEAVWEVLDRDGVRAFAALPALPAIGDPQAAAETRGD